MKVKSPKVKSAKRKVNPEEIEVSAVDGAVVISLPGIGEFEMDSDSADNLAEALADAAIDAGEQEAGWTEEVEEEEDEE